MKRLETLTERLERAVERLEKSTPPPPEAPTLAP